MTRVIWMSFVLMIMCSSLSANTEAVNSEEKDDFIFITDDIPEGFEDLAGPQVNQVDVYYQGKLLIGAEATYDFETLTFHNPEVIINNIDQLLDPGFILKNITGPLAVNADQLCLNTNTSIDCGVLRPNIAGIIFDESRFRVDLFINSQYLEVQYVDSAKFLPAAEGVFSTIHSFNLNLSGTDESEDSFNVQTNSIVAFADSRILAQSNFTDEEDYVLDEISVQKDFQGWEAEAGVFETESRATNFFSQIDVTGIRAQTSLNTRTDIERTSGTDIFIFLSVRSRVEVFRDSRLIDARFYDAGNRQLDTARFPDGAYEISVRIREESGSERTEQYFFVRNALLPPLDAPVYYAELGRVNELQQDSTLPESTDDYIVHAGVAFRASDNIGLEGEVVAVNDQTMLQAGVVHVAAGVQSQINVMATTENDWGVSVRESVVTNHVSFSMDYRFVNQGDQDVVDEGEFDLVSNDSTQASASLVHDFLGGRAFWRYRHLDGTDIEKSETYSLSYRRQFIREGPYQLDWDFEANKDSDDFLVGARLEFTFRKRNNLFRVDAGYQSARFNDETENDAVGSARWQHTQRSSKFGRVQTQLFHVNERNFDTTGVNISSESRYGFNELDLTRTSTSDNNINGYSVRSQLNIASDFQTISFGGAQRNDSAVIIDLDGQPENSIFEVFIDRQSVGFAKVGATTIFSLNPYETYDVRLESRSDSFLEFDQASREVTLYPGNVSTLTWDVNRVLVLIGRVVDRNGRPIQHAKITNVGTFAGTDERGWFQVETGSTRELILETKNGASCKINLGQYDTNEDVHVFDNLICIPEITTISEL